MVTECLARYVRAKGTLAYGYFYQLFWDHPGAVYTQFRLPDGITPEIVLSKHPRLCVRYATSEHEPRQLPGCQRFPELAHREFSVYRNVVVTRDSSTMEFWGHDVSSMSGRKVRKTFSRDGLIYCEESGYQFMGSRLYQRLLDRGFRGIKAVPVRADDFCNDWIGSDSDVVMVDGECAVLQPATIIPEHYNACQHCGAAPLLCPECGWGNETSDGRRYGCAKCGEPWCADESQARNPNSRCHVLIDLSAGAAVDLHRWDGSDLNVDGIATHRLKEFLMQAKVGSFQAYPVGVQIDNLTSEDRDRLQQAVTMP